MQIHMETCKHFQSIVPVPGPEHNSEFQGTVSLGRNLRNLDSLRCKFESLMGITHWAAGVKPLLRPSADITKSISGGGGGKIRYVQ